MTDPAWLVELKKWNGTKEVPGPGVNAKIRNLWLSLPGGEWYWKTYGEDDSKLPWCGAMMAGVMQRCGVSFPKKYASAREWAVWGTSLSVPAYGCIAVFARPEGAHVGVLVGKDTRGRYAVWGGNQSDGVCLTYIDASRAIAYRWPTEALDQLQGVSRVLPMVASTGKTSTNEA